MYRLYLIIKKGFLGGSGKKKKNTLTVQFMIRMHANNASGTRSEKSSLEYAQYQYDYVLMMAAVTSLVDTPH